MKVVKRRDCSRPILVCFDHGIENAISIFTIYTDDALGRRKTATQSSGTKTTNYDPANGRVTTRVAAKINTTTVLCDILGRQTTITDRLGKNTVRTYDSAGRLHTLTDAESKTTTDTNDLLNSDHLWRAPFVPLAPFGWQTPDLASKCGHASAKFTPC